MKVLIRTLPSTDIPQNIEGQWNSLVGESHPNPFLLTSLLKPFIKLCSAEGWSPIAVTVTSNGTLLGVVPLVVKTVYGLKLARFVLSPAYSPDLVIRDKSKDSLAPLIIDCMLSCLGCHLLSLDFKTNSQYLGILIRECKKLGVHYLAVSEMGHRMLPVESTWQNFENNKGGNFRRKFKKIERNLDKIGTWNIICANRDETNVDVLGKLLEVEKESWKETCRAKKGTNVDDVLLAIWKGLNESAKTQLDLDWAVWFLEMEGHPIAYTLVIFYSGVAYITKTSYNARYRRFYPGIYINHRAIRQLWDTKKVRLIDFLTDLQFMETWTDDVEGCTRVIISKNPIIPLLLGYLLFNEYAKKTLSPTIKKVLERIPGFESI